MADSRRITPSGLAFWRKATNTPTVTTGYEHLGRTGLATLGHRGARRGPLEEKLAQKFALLCGSLQRPAALGRPGRALGAEEVEENDTEFLARELLHVLAGLPPEELGQLVKRALREGQED